MGEVFVLVSSVWKNWFYGSVESAAFLNLTYLLWFQAVEVPTESHGVHHEDDQGTVNQPEVEKLFNHARDLVAEINLFLFKF